MFLVPDCDLDDIERFIIAAKESSDDERLQWANDLLGRIALSRKGHQKVDEVKR